MQYIIERMQLEELTETLKLVKDVFNEFEAPCYNREGIENFYQFANYQNIKNQLDNVITIFVAKNKQKIIGMIAIKNACHIAMLFVDKKYHRQGIGTQLIKEAKFYCKINNRDIEKITVNASPFAIPFYHKIGFEDTGKEQIVDGIKFTPMKLEMYRLKLVFPTQEYKEQLKEYLQEHRDNNEMTLSGAGGLDRLNSIDEWLEKVKNDVTRKEEGKVPATLFLAVRKSDNKVIGTIQIRHYLNERLLKNIGHIGDGVRPTERRKGYATEMIQLALNECKKIGIQRVMMGCYKDNIGSMKSIQNNGGILENEIVEENGKIDQRYWISLKKRYADKSVNNRVQKSNQNMLTVNDKKFTGDVYFYDFIEVKNKMMISNGKCILDNGYKWLEFYDYNSKIKLSAIYNEKSEIVEWYFDIAREIGKEHGIPYEDDLYLDVVVTPSGEIKLLDEDELKEAYDRLEISKKDYDMAYAEANKLMELLEENKKELKTFTDEYIKIFINVKYQNLI